MLRKTYQIPYKSTENVPETILQIYFVFSAVNWSLLIYFKYRNDLNYFFFF